MKTYIIYLAAGNSRRFGSNKLLHQINGKALYQYGLDNLVKLVSLRNDCKLIIVTQYFEIINAYPQLDFIYSPKSKDGISYSIKAGIKMIDKQEKCQIMFVVADQLNLKYQTINDLLDTYNDSSYSLASLVYGNRVGNPTIFDACYIEQLLSLSGDQGGRVIINQNKEHCLFYQIDNENELIDIDEIDDLLKGNDDEN